MDTQRRLDDILGRDIGLEWFEAVALVQAVCAQLLTVGPADVFPSAADVAVGADGSIAVLGSGGARPAVAAAGELLAGIVGDDVPVRLRLAISEANAAESPYRHLASVLGGARLFRAAGPSPAHRRRSCPGGDGAVAQCHSAHADTRARSIDGRTAATSGATPTTAADRAGAVGWYRRCGRCCVDDLSIRLPARCCAFGRGCFGLGGKTCAAGRNVEYRVPSRTVIRRRSRRARARATRLWLPHWRRRSQKSHCLRREPALRPRCSTTRWRSWPARQPARIKAAATRGHASTRAMTASCHRRDRYGRNFRRSRRSMRQPHRQRSSSS